MDKKKLNDNEFMQIIEAFVDDLPEKEVLDRIVENRKESIKNSTIIGQTSSGKDVYSYCRHPLNPMFIEFSEIELLEVIALFEKMEASESRGLALIEFRNLYKRRVAKRVDAENEGKPKIIQ